MTNWPKRDVLPAVGPLEVRPDHVSRVTLQAGMATIPLLAYGGVAPGPVLYVQALQHGLELNGVDVMRRLVQTLDPATLSGTLILVPMANTLAARVHMQSFPYPDRPTQRLVNDMNRRWREPLAGGPNHVDQVVAALAPIIGCADVMIDLHCHEYLYPSMVLTNMQQPACRALALAMGFEMARHGEGTEGMFDKYGREVLDKPTVTVEMPPLRRVDPRSSAAGYRGVINAMKTLGMLDGEPGLPARTVIFGFGKGQTTSVMAEHEGFMARYADGGDEVAAGQVVAEIWSPDDFTVTQEIRAPFAGFVTSIGRAPQVWGEPEHDFINIGERAVIFSTADEVVYHQGHKAE